MTERDVETPTVLGVAMTKAGSRWRLKLGPIEYTIETDQRGIDPSKAITWLYYDYSTGPVRVAGRTVPVIGPLHWCVAAIEGELRVMRAAIERLKP